MTTVTDNYQRRLGQQFAIDMLCTLNNLINDKKFALPAIDRLEQSCGNKPASFAGGVKKITSMIRIELES